MEVRTVLDKNGGLLHDIILSTRCSYIGEPFLMEVCSYIGELF